MQLTTDPDRRASAAWYAAKAYLSARLYPDALALGDQSVALSRKNPGSLPSALALRCEIRASSGQQLALAAQDCDESLRLAPGDQNHVAARAYVSYRMGDHQTALTYIRQAGPRQAGERWNADYLYLAGKIEQAMGDQAGGRADITAATAARADAGSAFATYDVVGR